MQLAVMLYVRFPLSLRNVEDLLHERGVDVSTLLRLLILEPLCLTAPAIGVIKVR